MLPIIKKVIAPLLSLFVFMFGSGFFLTLLSLTMNFHHEAPLMVGAMTGMYYAGLVCGSFKIERFIVRVGHIRAFSTFASALAVMSLLHGIFYNMPFWLVLRFLSGFMTAGAFVVIESWLLCNSTTSTRGRILSLYMMTYYAAQACGQLLINLGNPDDLLLFGIATMLCSLSVIPLAMTYVTTPQFDEPSTMNLKTLYKKTMSSIFGCFCAGMTLSASYALFPIIFSNIYHEASKISLFMFCLIMGGMALQYPVGKVSDTVDRRFVVIILSCLVAVTSLLLIVAYKYYISSIILIIILGGLTFTIYPICISYACDSLDNNDIVAGIQGLLLSYSLGATIGPFVAPFFMHVLKEPGLFVYFIVIAGSVAGLFAWRKTQTDSPPQEEPFRVMTQTTPVMVEIDPRGE
ncbi:MAG: MFS transporter [Gammaproteobacteria bacterium]|nr:MFS transporter [Gammaproteobacteria bacterium]